jgi:hypothetical protein
MSPSQTLPDFQQYLLLQKLVPQKSVTLYASWANRNLTFSKRLDHADAAEALRPFLEDLQSRQEIGGDFVIWLLRTSTPFFSNQLYDKAPHEMNSWFPRYNGRLPKKARPANT